MHLVYKIIFVDRQKDNIKPYYYIGSKSNCVVKDGIMYCKERKKEYWGSSTDSEMKSLIGTTKVVIEEIKWFSNYKECLKYERTVQINENVVSNTEYFNKSIAMENNFTDPDYATYKNLETNKIVRLRTDHPDVLSGFWVGVSKGTILTDDEKKKRGLKGDKNHFYGKHHSEVSKDLIRKGQQEWKQKNIEKDDEIRKNAATRIKDRCLGIPKTESQKEKMSISGRNYVTLKNINNGDCIRIKKDSIEYCNLNLNEWISPISYSKLKGTIKKVKCAYCDTISNQTNINRWHNENCKRKENNENKDY